MENSNKTVNDKRSSPRYPLSVEAEIQFVNAQNETLSQITQDISSGGLLINCENGFQDGAKANVFLKLPLNQLKDNQGNLKIIALKAHVVRSDANQFALEFEYSGHDEIH